MQHSAFVKGNNMNYIFTSCTGYKPHQIRHFLTSFRNNAADAQLVVFGGNLPIETVHAIHDVGGIFVDIIQHYEQVTRNFVCFLKRVSKKDKTFRLSYQLLSSIDRLRYGSSNGLQFATNGIMGIRHIEYFRYTSGLDPLGSILLTDIRDVIFQRSVFEQPLTGLELFAEENKKIGECYYNYSWLKQVAGQRIAKSMASCDVICAGTTAGDFNAILNYLTKMHSHIDNSTFPIGPQDQGIHNYLYYSGGLGDCPVEVRRNKSGRVQTIGNGTFDIDNGYLRGHGGEITPIVHQWDRCNSLHDWANRFCQIGPS
jgi:hypothetical protein